MDKKTGLFCKIRHSVLCKLIVIALIAFIPTIITSKIFPTGQVEQGAPLKEFTDHLDTRIPALMQDYEIPGLSIALIERGETVWKSAYGYADVEGGRKMTVDTYCRFESISKSVTAWGVMRLVEQGLVDLDAPVEQYITTWKIPESDFSEDKVTIRRLLSGSSGMPLGTIGVHYPPKAEDIPTLKDLLTKDAVLINEPGSSFYYSNTGFNILELLIEEVTGRGFAEYMQDEILTPLGMHSARFEWSKDFTPPVANGYGTEGVSIPVYIYPDKAAGGLFGTLEDVATFAAAGMTDFDTARRNALTSKSIETMYTPISKMSSYYQFVFEGYGLGHFVEYLPDGTGRTKAVSHGGQGSGWMTDFHSIPKTGDGIVILSNSQRTWPGFAYILTDWAKWLGYSSIGMGVIITVQKIAWISIALILFLLIRHVWRLAEGLFLGTRRFAPMAVETRMVRSVQFLLSLLLLGVFLWVSSLEYWFIDSVLPIASSRLNFSILFASLVLLASAVFTKRRDEHKGDYLPNRPR